LRWHENRHDRHRRLMAWHRGMRADAVRTGPEEIEMAGRMKLVCTACVVAALTGGCSSSSESAASTAASIAPTDTAAPATEAPAPTSIETSVESTSPAATTSE